MYAVLVLFAVPAFRSSFAITYANAAYHIARVRGERRAFDAAPAGGSAMPFVAC